MEIVLGLGGQQGNISISEVHNAITLLKSGWSDGVTKYQPKIFGIVVYKWAVFVISAILLLFLKKELIMDSCKYCLGEDLAKNGRPNGVQRYRCKSCGTSQIEGDKRLKYPNSLRYLAVSMYLNNSGFRAIGRVL